MGAVRRMSPPPWNRPGTRSVARPSWIGKPHVSVVPPGPPSASRGLSNHPPADVEPASVRGERISMVPASIRPLHGSLPPSSSPLIQSGRELELENEVHALREEVARLAVELATTRARVLEESEPEIVRLAMTVASLVVGREVAAEPTLLLQWIHEGFANLPGRDEAVVAVASDVAAMIARDPAHSSVLADRKVIVDAALRPGSCELREGASTVPIGTVERLAAIADVLGVDKDR